MPSGSGEHAGIDGELEERIADMESCRSRLIDVMRDVAAARSGGYEVLAALPDVALPSLFRFGRRSKGGL